MHPEYVPPPLPDRINAHNSTEGLPARAVDLRLWLTRLTALKARSEDSRWTTGDNPYLDPLWLNQRIEIYGKRIRAEQELINSDSTVKFWQPGELPGYLK